MNLMNESKHFHKLETKMSKVHAWIDLYIYVGIVVAPHFFHQPHQANLFAFSSNLTFKSQVEISRMHK